MSHTINNLREHLFATIKDLRNKKNPLEIDRAKAIADVAQTIINSAKVEVEHLKITGADSNSGFIPLESPPAADPTSRLGCVQNNPAKGTSTTVQIINGQRVTRHTAK